MNKKTIRTFTCRMSYDDAEHVKIMQTLDDLNMDAYKSVNKFIIEALKYYIKAMDDGTLTNEDVRQSKDYVSRTELKEELGRYNVRLEKLRTDVKNSLYEEIFKLLTGTLIVSGSPIGQRTMSDNAIQHSNVDNNNVDMERVNEEDVFQQISRYDNVLSQVMSWGDE